MEKAEIIRLAEEYIKLEENESIKSFEINYINEMQVGNFTLYSIKDGNKRLIRGFSNEKESFRAVVEVFKGGVL